MNGNYGVGKKGQGGIIFYDKGSTTDDWRYLEFAPLEKECTATWGAYDRDIPGTQSAVGTGKSNTDLIVSCLGQIGENGKAAQLCAGLDFNGYKDWFLPSKDELDLLYHYLERADLKDFKEGGLYWSSNQCDRYSAFYQNLGSSYQGGYKKSEELLVRPVRRFY